MKVWRLKFVNVVHQKTVRKVAVDVMVQLKAVGIDQGRRRAQDAGQRESPNTVASADLPQGIIEPNVLQSGPLPHRAEPVNPNQRKAH